MKNPSLLKAHWIDSEGRPHPIAGHAITVELPNGQTVEIDLLEHPMGLSVSVFEGVEPLKKRSRSHSQQPYFNIVPGACNVFFVQVITPGTRG